MKSRSFADPRQPTTPIPKIRLTMVSTTPLVNKLCLIIDELFKNQYKFYTSIEEVELGSI